MARARTLMRPLAVVMAALTVAGGAVACSSDDALNVCTSIPYEPFEYKDSWQDNKVVGFDIDLVELIAKDLGKTPHIIDTDFGAIDSGRALETGECDIAAAALTITKERAEVMDFSQPYYNADQGLAVIPDNGILSLKDLKGKLLGIQTETTGEAYALEQQAEFGYEIKTYADLGELKEALLFGVIDGAIGDIPLWNAEADKNPDLLAIYERFITGEQYGFAVAEGNTDLLDSINSVLDQAKKDGTFGEIYLEWIKEPWTAA